MGQMDEIDYFEDDIDLCHDDDDTIKEQHCCSECMDCLGLSWRDFF